MKIALAKEYFDLGLVTGVIVRAPTLMHDGWTIELEGRVGNALPVIETDRGEVRTWRTLDAAAKAVRQIGPRQWSVVTD
jgi:hypothetical protein